MSIQPTTETDGEVQLPMTNDRPTAARNVSTKSFAGFAPPGSPPIVSEERWDAEPWQSLGDVPGREAGRHLTLQIVDPIKARYLNAAGELYVSLRVRYCDIFGQPHSYYGVWHRHRDRPAGSSIYLTQTDQDVGDSAECAD